MENSFIQEIQFWPLIHGSLTLYENIHFIREGGLKAPILTQKSLNTFDYDIVLGRNRYIFLAPCKLKSNYGGGTFLFIDPLVLHKQGVKYALMDIGEVVRQIDHFLFGIFYSHIRHKFPTWIKEPQVLEKIIWENYLSSKQQIQQQEENNQLNEVLLEYHTKENIIRSKYFKKYLNLYELDQGNFYAEIDKQCNELGYSLSDYLMRDWTWPLSEEIMAPETIDSKYILGYWDINKWTEWVPASNNDVASRLRQCIDLLSN